MQARWIFMKLENSALWVAEFDMATSRWQIFQEVGGWKVLEEASMARTLAIRSWKQKMQQDEFY